MAAYLKIQNYKQLLLNGERFVFIDWYNDKGLLFFLSLNMDKEIGHNFSWWSITNEYFPKYLNGDPTVKDSATLTIEGCQHLKDRMIEAHRVLTSRDTYYTLKGKDKIPISDKTEVYRYMNWLDQLICFLDKAIEIDSPVIWSV
jgi:hypothetical protein